MNKNTLTLVDYKINTKIKLAGLWTFLLFLYVYADYFDMKAPGVVEQMINLETPLGPLTPNLLIIFSFIAIIPSLMILFSLLLKSTFNKWMNITVAAIWSLFSVLLLIDLIGSEWYLFYVLFQIIEIVVFATIIWTAWNWPKVEH